MRDPEKSSEKLAGLAAKFDALAKKTNKSDSLLTGGITVFNYGLSAVLGATLGTVAVGLVRGTARAPDGSIHIGLNAGTVAGAALGLLVARTAR